VDQEFQVEDRVFLRVRTHNSSICYGKGSKLALIYVFPFEILERIDPIAYRLALPPILFCIHDVFHVSMLKKYVPDLSHVLDWDAL